MTIIEDNDLAARYAATRPAPTPPARWRIT